MPGAAQALHIVLATWVAALAALVAFRVVTRRIRVAGLLSDARRRISPERVQMLIATLAVGVLYATTTLRAGAFPETPPGMPALDSAPTLLVAALGGSQGLYLLGKLFRRS